MLAIMESTKNKYLKFKALLNVNVYCQNAEVEKKELKIAHLEATNTHFVQELVEQKNLITKMKQHLEEKEKLCSSQCEKVS